MAAGNPFYQPTDITLPDPPPYKDNTLHTSSQQQNSLSTSNHSEITTHISAADTDAGAATPLFPPDLISPTVAAALPPSYTIRPLQRSDYGKGFLDVLRVLTQVGEIGRSAWEERYEWMARQGKGGYYVLVVLDGRGKQDRVDAGGGDEEGRIVGTGALVVERKFIHNLGLVGHIEDIAVARDQQGMKLGLRIIQALDYVAERVGCYKSILDCSEANEGFYVKCGFKRAGLEMAHYYEASKT